MKYQAHQDGSMETYDDNTTAEIVHESTHSFEVKEAITLGSIEKALILKEVRRMAVYKVRVGKSPWVYYSASALSEKFPYMNGRTIERWLKQLVDDGYLVSQIKNKHKYDQTKSYTLPQFKDSIPQIADSTPQNDQPIPPLSYSSVTPLVVEEPRRVVKITEDEDKPSHPDRRVKDKVVVYNLFSSKRQPWWEYKQDRKAALWLFDNGLEKLKRGLRIMRENEEDQYCPQASTPHEYVKKLPQLRRYAKKNNL